MGSLEGPACQVRALEGCACRVRSAMLDDPSHFGGRDKHAPPMGSLEGPACQVRRITFDHPSWYAGRAKRVPPTLLVALQTNLIRTQGTPWGPAKG